MAITIDNKIYSVVATDTLYWMQQNLDFKSMNNQTGAEEYMTFNRNDSHIMYGYLYNWDTAQQIVSELGSRAPTGWRLPTRAEAQSMITYFGGSTCAGKIRANSHLWMHKIGGVNEPESLALLPGGYMNELGQVFDIGYGGYFWTSDAKNSTLGYSLQIQAMSNKVEIKTTNKKYKLSIRLVKEINRGLDYYELDENFILR